MSHPHKKHHVENEARRVERLDLPEAGALSGEGRLQKMHLHEEASGRADGGAAPDPGDYGLGFTGPKYNYTDPDQDMGTESPGSRGALQADIYDKSTHAPGRFHDSGTRVPGKLTAQNEDYLNRLLKRKRGGGV